MSGKLAIHGGEPVRKEPWPGWPVHGGEEERALLEVLRSGTWGVNGSRVPEFERRYAELHGAKHGVACCNGTIALQIALVAAGVQPGDEVITSPYTFMATALAILTVGGVPVFADVRRGTHNLDPDEVERAITPRTRAILPVHIGGRPADMDRLLAIAREHGLLVVEDAAQAWLASWKGTPVGALGHAGIFSFQSSKNITAGEGGIVLTNDDETWQRAWSYHNCGRTLGGEWYVHDHPGLNYRLTEFQAAILLAQLDRLPAQQETRRRAMAVLDEELPGIEGILVPERDDRVTAHGAHIYMVRLDPEVIPVDKMTFVRALQEEGIPAHPGYTTPLYQQSFWDWFAARPTGGGRTWGEVFPRPYREYRLPVCEELCRTTVWIKQNVLLAGPEAMGDVVAAFDKVARAAREGRL